MNWAIQFQLKFSLSLGLFIMMSLMSQMAPALAEVGQVAKPSGHSASVDFKLSQRTDPPDRGTPPAGRGTGSRSGDCLRKPGHPPLTLLVGKKGFDQTVSDRPTFWVYVPYTPDEAPFGEFVLQDGQGQEDLYREQFQLPSTPGIVSITLPATVPALSAGKHYRWYFEVSCPTRATARQPIPASVTGLVKRGEVPAALITELKASETPLQRATSYAKYGFWFDSVTEIAQLRLSQPQNQAAKQAWMELLQSEMDLQLIADRALVGQVTASSQPR